jgi:glycosyltransferase involved in cell wall biosynthesis/Tfp pilus assembly protein PilF
LKTLTNAKDETGAWLVEVKSEAITTDRKKDVYVSNLLRLFRNKPFFKYEGIVHEQIVNSIISNGYQIESSPVKLFHLGYALSPEEMYAKQSRNLNLLNIAIEIDENDVYAKLQRAKTFLAMNNLQKAEADINFVIHHAEANGTILPQALNYGAIISLKNSDADTAVFRATRSVELLPDQVFANFILADLFLRRNQYTTALESYKKVERAILSPSLKARIVGDYFVSLADIYFKIGRCHTLLNQISDAEKAFVQGYNTDKDNVHILVGLANIAFKKHDYHEAENLLLNAKSLAPDNKDILKFLDQLKKHIRQPLEITQSINHDLSKPRISVSMIVKNEEKMLPDCLESIKDIADEIIIVDTGSSDRTKEIANVYNAKLFDFKWIDDFSAARNHALKHCSGDWILYLDADERLEESSKEELLKVIRTQDNNIGGFICIIQSSHMRLDGSPELHRGGYPRLFKNFGYPSIHFKGRVHEQITPSIIALNKVFVLTDIKIRHLGYNQPREIMEEKIKRNYKMLLAHIKDEPTYGYAWYQLGQTLAQMRIFNEAEEAIRFALKCGDLSDSIYASATATLSQMTGSQKKFSEALFWAEESLKKAPEQLYSISLKAHALLFLDRLDEAEHYFNVLKDLKNSKRGVPLSGFDIEVPDNIIEIGLNELAKRRHNK